MSKLTFLLAAISVSLNFRLAEGSIETYVATGTVNYVNDSFGYFLGVAAGVPFTSTTTLDTSVPDTDASPTSGYYSQDFATTPVLSAAITLHLTSGDVTYTNSTPILASVGVENQMTYDYIYVSAWHTGIVAGNPVTVGIYPLMLRDNSAVALTNDSFPSLLDLTNFSYGQIYIQIDDPNTGVGQVYGLIDSLTVSTASAPEPMSALVWCGLLSAVGVVSYRAMRRAA